METRENILQELEQISQAVATISNRNVYTVPAGYFDNLAEEVLAKVQLAPLQALPMPFSVPAGYFDSLAGNIMDKIRAQEKSKQDSEPFEESEQPSLLLNTISKQVPYSVPAGYFDNLAGNIIDKIRLQERPAQYSEVFEELQQLFPLLNTIGKQVPYSVPAGYFDTLAGNITGKIRLQEEPVQHSEVFEELEQLSPLLNTISKQMPYSVPEGYFQQFSVNVNAETQQAAKVVSIKSSRPKWVMYLAAACVTGILGIGGYLFTQHNTVTIKPGGSLNIEKALAGLSDDDINSYLDNQTSNSPDVVPIPVDVQTPDVQPSIENMSTEEIQQYLKDNSGPDEKRKKDI